MSQKKQKTKANKTTMQKKLSDKELMEFASDIVKTAGFSTHPKVLLPELGKALEEWKQATDKKDKEKKLKVFNEKYRDAIYVHALDNHSAIAETVNQSYQPLVIQMTNELISDFGCDTAYEKALAELVASSYVRYIQNSRKFLNAQHIDYLSSEKTNFYTMFSKEADKAHRQFTTALATLKQMKSPTPSVNVKAKNAFVAQNQQLNAYKEDERKEVING